MSFPSLGVSLGGSVSGTRRVTARIRGGGEVRDLFSESRGAVVTEWIHPQMKKELRREDARRRAEERERQKDEEAVKAALEAGGFTSAYALARRDILPTHTSATGRSNSQTTRGRANSKDASTPSGQLPTPSALLLASYVPGKICTLNRKVGKIVYVGYLSNLDGCWICLATYRSHGVGRRPVFDFSTVSHEKRGNVLTPIETPIPPEQISTRIQLMGIGLENYDDSPTKCEVDTATIAKAQREAMKLLGTTCTGDHAVFVRVEDPRPGDLTSRSHHATFSSTAASTTSLTSPIKDQTTLLPVLTTPRIGVGASLTPLPSSPLPSASVTSTPVKKSDKKKKRRDQLEEGGNTLTPITPVKPAPSFNGAASSKPNTLTNTESKESEPISSTSSILTPSPPSSRAPIRSLPSPPPATVTLPNSFDSDTIEGESQLPLMARKLQLTGPFAEVDAVALTTPASFAQTPFTLSKYLTNYFPHTICTAEKKARVLFRWITANIAMAKNPLLDRLRPGEKIKTESENGAGAIKDAIDQAIEQLPGLHPNEMPSASTLKHMAKEIQNATQLHTPQVSDGTETPFSTTDEPETTTSLGALSLSEKAQAFHRMDLGFGPSSKTGGRLKTKNSRTRRRQRMSNGMSSSTNESFGSMDFGGGYTQGYSSEEQDGADEEFDDDAVEAVMKKNLEAKKNAEAKNATSSPTGTSATPATSSPTDSNAHLSAETVLQSRLSTPYGFAILFQALAAIAGLECLVLRGLLKYGPDYRKRVAMNIKNLDDTTTTNMLTKPSDHSQPITAYSDWNLIRLDERWYIIDCFSSAGIWDVNAVDLKDPDADGMFIRQFSSCYFAPAPENFILNHFPLFVYKHTGVEHLIGNLGQGQTRKYRTVIGNSISNSIQTLNRFGQNKAGSQLDDSIQIGKVGGFTTKDPLAMASHELINQPRALQLIQPPISKPEWDMFVNISRLYIDYYLETYETEYEINYGINALGSGVAGTTFQIEIEVPVWMECGVELTKINSHEAIQELTDELRIGTKMTGSNDTTPMTSPTNHSTTSATPSQDASPISSSAPSLSAANASALLGSLDDGISVAPPKVDPTATQNFDLTTCWFAQKAVGTRLEIRSHVTPGTTAASKDAHPPGSPSLPVTTASTLQRHKKIQHRTRMKIHLVFPKHGQYRVIIYCKNHEIDKSFMNKAVTEAPASSNPDAVGTVAESMANWAALMEYSITVNQGVSDLPKRKIIVQAPAKPIINDPNIPSPIASSTSAYSSSSLPLVIIPPQRHLFVGFLQLYKPTFSLPSIRMIASQIVCVRPWLGYWELGSSFQLQYVTPKEVVEMIIVTDGRWSPFNEGGLGLVQTRFPTAQREILSTVTQTFDGTSVNQPREVGVADPTPTKSKAPVLHYQQGQERNVFTLDWSMVQVPEIYIYFKVGIKYYLLSYLLPTERNHIKDAPIVLTKSEERRLAASLSIKPEQFSTATTTLKQPQRDPFLNSRFFLSPSGVVFDYQIHYQSCQITRSSLVLILDCLRETEVRAKLVEGWTSGRAAREQVEQQVPEHELYFDTIQIDEVLELTPTPVSEQKSSKNFASMPKVLRPRPSSKPATPLDLDPTAPLAANPFHQRMRVSANIPSPDAIQNTSSTKYFTLLIYVWSREQGKLDNNGEWTDEPTAANSPYGRRPNRPLSTLSPHSPQSTAPVKMFRFAFSMHLYAGEGDQGQYPPP